MYKVFINDKSINLTDKYDDYTSDYDSLFIKHTDEETLRAIINLLSDLPVLKTIIIQHDQLDELWQAFLKQFELIEAAGGIVQNNGNVLFINKKDHWDLPKGKIEKNESTEVAAIREVKEECGIQELTAPELFETTYHIYTEVDKKILKKTHWFKMKTSEEGPFQGDSKEGITEVKWMNADEWHSAQSKSFASVVDLLASVY